jgi:hypothetical protein
MMVLDLVGNPEVENIPDYLDWATTEDNLRYGTVINCTLGSYGHCADLDNCRNLSHTCEPYANPRREEFLELATPSKF